jgi:hypothetical protein
VTWLKVAWLKVAWLKVTWRAMPRVNAALPHEPAKIKIMDLTGESWRSSKIAFVHHLEWL